MRNTSVFQGLSKKVWMEFGERHSQLLDIVQLVSIGSVSENTISRHCIREYFPKGVKSKILSQGVTGNAAPRKCIRKYYP